MSDADGSGSFGGGGMNSSSSALVMGIGQQEIDPAEVTLADIQSRSYLYWNDTDSIGEASNNES